VSITMQDVTRYLDADEPDYELAALLGPDALAQLELLVRGRDPMLASKATHLAGLIRDPGALQVLQAAAESAEPIVRIAAASTAALMPSDQASTLLSRLLTDSDPEIRRIAIESIASEAPPQLERVLGDLARADPYPSIRDSAAKVLRRSSQH